MHEQRPKSKISDVAACARHIRQAAGVSSKLFKLDGSHLAARQIKEGSQRSPSAYFTALQHVSKDRSRHRLGDRTDLVLRMTTRTEMSLTEYTVVDNCDTGPVSRPARTSKNRLGFTNEPRIPRRLAAQARSSHSGEDFNSRYSCDHQTGPDSQPSARAHATCRGVIAATCSSARSSARSSS